MTISLAVRAQTPLADFIDQAAAAPPYDHAIWGIVVEEEDGTRLYARNANTLLMPASNRKLFAASTIVECLGPDHQFATELWLDGDDVVLKGDGDPSFGGRYYDPPSLALQPFVDALRRRGIRRVRNVIADVSRFDRDTIPGSWKLGNLPYSYAAPIDALTYEENVGPGEITTVEPGLFAADALREALTLAGIRVDGALRLNVTPRAWRERVASVPSPLVRQILTTVLKNSHNLYTEVLFKDLSATPASYGESLAIDRRFLTEEVGLTGDEFRFVDGCGLSADDLVTPAALIRIVRWMNAPARRATFLPLMAETGSEGTLRNRNKTLGSRVHAKTGTINGVNALSGVVTMPDGRSRYFSIVLNHHLADGDEANKVIDSIVAAIAND
ncbi:MAG TPA: D-alanyl-D-alanine carboxypeptidase [Thermoanaerobaculia bacterium]|nr:D-alanyl-D-alanine carboxypeptidase [Thermoanaerobaculia bacterium]